MARSRRDIDELLASLLAAGMTQRDAAAQLTISERTVYQRLQKPEFTATVKRLRDGMVFEAAGRLTDAMTSAVNVLRALLSSESEGVRLRAADLLLVHQQRVVELHDVAERLAVLEQRAGEARR